MRQTLTRFLKVSAVLAVVYVFFLGLLMEHRAKVELNKAREFRGQEDFDSANRHYFQALNWYAPWGSSQVAADELMEYAIEGFNHGLKLNAFQSLLRLRSGLLAARSFYIPRPDLLEKANVLIALYLAELKLGPQVSQADVRAQAEIYLKLYAIDTVPKQRWYFFVLIGFLLWVLAIFWLIIIFFGQKRQFNFSQRLKKAIMPISIFVYGYALWVFSMSAA